MSLWQTSNYPQHCMLSGRSVMPTAGTAAIVDGKRLFSETIPVRWP